jgi:hypothetical protein
MICFVTPVVLLQVSGGGLFGSLSLHKTLLIMLLFPPPAAPITTKVGTGFRWVLVGCAVWEDSSGIWMNNHGLTALFGMQFFDHELSFGKFCQFEGASHGFRVMLTILVQLGSC